MGLGKKILECFNWKIGLTAACPCCLAINWYSETKTKETFKCKHCGKQFSLGKVNHPKDCWGRCKGCGFMRPELDANGLCNACK